MKWAAEAKVGARWVRVAVFETRKQARDFLAPAAAVGGWGGLRVKGVRS